MLTITPTLMIKAVNFVSAPLVAIVLFSELFVPLVTGKALVLKMYLLFVKLGEWMAAGKTLFFT
jgi:hypothetical protein